VADGELVDLPRFDVSPAYPLQALVAVDGIYLRARPQRDVGGVFQAADQVGAALTTPLGGLIIAHAGYQPVFIIGAVVYVVAFAVLWFRFRHFERTHVKDIADEKSEVVPSKAR